MHGAVGISCSSMKSFEKMQYGEISLSYPIRCSTESEVVARMFAAD